MKKLHILLLRSYIGPFFMTFVIATFILLMQFLWKYIDDLVGKGLEWYVVGELLFYASATFVPLSLPLAVLLSSIMTMGNMGEHYELVALKSSGISLTTTMKPLFFVSLFLVITAFYFANNVLPVANLKMGSLLYDVRHQRPAFNIKEGVFYKGIDNYVIRVDKKESDGKTLKGIKIYNHTKAKGNNNLTIAKWGFMEFTPDKNFLMMTLYDGCNYQEVIENKPRPKAYPFQRTEFSEQMVVFDLSEFNLSRTDEDFFRNNYQMMNISQLTYYEYSMKINNHEKVNEFINTFPKRLYYLSTIDSVKLARLPNTQKSPFFLDTLFLNLNNSQKDEIIEYAMNAARSAKDHIYYNEQDFKFRTRQLAKYQVEYHKKFTLSIACLIMFLIGAPLGAIIRRGGFGLPVVVSILFFILFYVITITSEKFVKEGVLAPDTGMYIATFILFPLGIILTLKATTDSGIMDGDTWKKLFKKSFSRFFPKK
ncbi:MAG: YjgP/YjgQ family permease [Bacteroidales bacterium]|nr:YjgP/YjgQ family permease [Bacteroidales bacterium]